MTDPAPRIMQAWHRVDRADVTVQTIRDLGGTWVGPTFYLGAPYGMQKGEHIIKANRAQRQNPDVQILLTCRPDAVGPRVSPPLYWARSFDPNWISTVPYDTYYAGLEHFASLYGWPAMSREHPHFMQDWGWWGECMKPHLGNHYPVIDYTSYGNTRVNRLVQLAFWVRMTEPAYRAWAVQQIVQAAQVYYIPATIVYWVVNLQMAFTPQPKPPPYKGHGMICENGYAEGEYIAGFAAMVEDLQAAGLQVAVKTNAWDGVGDVGNQDGTVWSAYPQATQDKLVAEVHTVRAPTE